MIRTQTTRQKGLARDPAPPTFVSAADLSDRLWPGCTTGSSASASALSSSSPTSNQFPPPHIPSLTCDRASTTSPTFLPLPHRPRSHLHELPDMRYSSAERSLTRACCASLSGWSETRERRVSRSLETVWVKVESILGNASERVKSAESVPAWRKNQEGQLSGRCRIRRYKGRSASTRSATALIASLSQQSTGSWPSKCIGNERVHVWYFPEPRPNESHQTHLQLWHLPPHDLHTGTQRLADLVQHEVRVPIFERSGDDPVREI